MKLSKTIAAILGVGLIGCALFSEHAQAVPITGGITFLGTVQLNSTSAGTASQVTSWAGPFGTGTPAVAGADGSFAGGGVIASNSAAFFAPWNFNSGPIAGFWVVTGMNSPNTTFTFNLISSFITSKMTGPPGSVSVNGTGIIHASGPGSAGLQDTPGTWSFTTQDPSTGTPARFSFSAATGAVPDSGATVALLGMALTGMELLRRKLGAKAV